MPGMLGNHRPSESMPFQYHGMDYLSIAELSSKIRMARQFELTTVELLNLLVYMRRKGSVNELNSLLDFLVNQPPAHTKRQG